MILTSPWSVSQWRSLKFTLLASSRPDIELGISSFRGNSRIHSGLSSGQSQQVIQFKRVLPTVSNYISRPFLAGFTLTQTSNIVSIALAGADMTVTTMTVNVLSNSAPSAVTISYILFSPPTANFASYGGVIEHEQLPSAVSMSVHKELSTLSNFIYGLNSFAMGANQRISLSSNVDNQFVLTISPGQITTRVSLLYIIFGVRNSFVCSNCANKLSDLFGNCQAMCGPGEATFTYSDGSVGCVRCPDAANLVVSQDGRNCVCKPGTTSNRGACVFTEGIRVESSFGAGMGSSSSSTSSSSWNQQQSQSQQSSANFAASNNAGLSVVNAGTVLGGAGGVVTSQTVSVSSGADSGRTALRPIFGDSGARPNQVGSSPSTGTFPSNSRSFVISQPTLSASSQASIFGVSPAVTANSFFNGNQNAGTSSQVFSSSQ